MTMTMTPDEEAEAAFMKSAVYLEGLAAAASRDDPDLRYLEDEQHQNLIDAFADIDACADLEP